MEHKANISKYSIIIKFVSVLLALALVAGIGLTVAADGEGKGKWIRELIVVTAKDTAEAQKKADDASEATKKTGNASDERKYYVYDKPVYSSDKVKTYLCYATTNKPTLAITSIKAMNMEGGWSYTKYNEYLEQASKQANKLADDFLVAIREYKSNLELGEEEAPKSYYARDHLLNMFRDDDHDQTIADFFAEVDEIGFNENKYRERLITIIMQSNTSILGAIQNALMVACADTYGIQVGLGNSLFDLLEQDYFLDSTGGMTGEAYEDYDRYADDIIKSLPDVQKYLKYYEDSNMEYTANMELMASKEEDLIYELAEDEEMSTEEYIKQHDEIGEQVIEAVLDESNPLDLDKDMQQAALDLEQYKDYFEALSFEEQYSYTTGRMLHAAFSECNYKGRYVKDPNTGKQVREFKTLLDLIKKYDLSSANTPKDNYKTSDFYPLLQVMSEGQMAMLKVGLTQFVGSIFTSTGLLDANKKITLAAVNSEAEEGQEFSDEDEISVYFGVDRLLYQKDSGVALTSKAVEEAKTKEWGEKIIEESTFQKVAKVLCYFTGGAAAISVGMSLGIPLYLKTAMAGANELVVKTSTEGVITSVSPVCERYLFNTIQMEIMSARGTDYMLKGSIQRLSVVMGKNKGKFIEYTVKNSQAFAGSYGNCMRVFFMTTLGNILYIANWITIAITLLSVVLYIVAYVNDKNKDNEYISIPRALYSSQEVYNEDGTYGEEEFMYYYGVKNPFLGETESALAGEKADILKYKVADIANWSQSGPKRQWVALYTSTDKRAGRPILTDTFSIETDALNAGVSVQKFNEGDPYDLHTYYGKSLKKTVDERYLCYKIDTAAYTASVLSEVTPLGALFSGFVAGGALGAVVVYFINKKRRNNGLTTA